MITVNDYLLHVVEVLDRLEIQNHTCWNASTVLFPFLPCIISTLALLIQLTPLSSHLCAEDVYKYKNARGCSNDHRLDTKVNAIAISNTPGHLEVRYGKATQNPR